MRFSFSKPGKSTSTPILSPSRESRFPSSVWAHNPHSHGYHTCQGEPHWEFRLHAGGQKRINMQLCSNTFRHSLTLIKKKICPAQEQSPSQPKSRELVLSGDQKQNQGKLPPNSIFSVIIIERITTDANSKTTIRRQRLPKELLLFPQKAPGYDRNRRFDFKT